jgi:hypothetical protein
LAAALLLAFRVTAGADEPDKDTLAGMDAEVRGDWVEAAQAFARAAEAEPGDARRGTRLRYARQRGIDFWRTQIDLLFKEKRPEDAARAVAFARLVDPDHAAAAGATQKLKALGVAVPDLPAPAEGPAPFPQRSAAGRLRCWVSLGASFAKAERLIDAGIRFLVATQEENGSWDSDEHGGGPLFDTGNTALALLALLADGKPEGDREPAARRAAENLAGRQADDGCIGSRASYSFLYGSTLATEALAEYAILAGGKERFGRTIGKGRDFIVDAQNPGSGWRYEPRGGDSDTSLTACAVAALERVRLAGFDVPHGAFRGGLAWVDQMTEAGSGRIGYISTGGMDARPRGKEGLFPPEHGAAMTGAGVLVVCYVGEQRATLSASLSILAAHPPSERYADIYYWWRAARAFVAATGQVPATWYAALVDAAKALSRLDGAIASRDVWGDDGGRIYATAMTVLALAAPYAEPAEARPDLASQFVRTGAREVHVPAAVAATPTGIYAEPGMRVLVTGRGQIQPWVGSPKSGVDGIKHEIKSYRPLLKGAPFACLLGRIGPEGRPFRIQCDKPLALAGHGQLFLLANDERPEDGTGAWKVRLEAK